jgi:hypothetical protein
VRRLDEALRLVTPGVPATVLVARDQRVLVLDLVLPVGSDLPVPGTTVLRLATGPSPAVAALRKAWLAA